MRTTISLVMMPVMVALGGCAKLSNDMPSTASVCGAPQTAIVTLGGGPHEDDGRLAGSFPASSVGETVRQISWQLCNARDKGWIDDDYFRRELTTLRDQAFNAGAGAGSRKSAATTPPTPDDKAAPPAN